MNAPRARFKASTDPEETVDTIICPSTPPPEAEAEKVEHSHSYGRDSSGANEGTSEGSEELPGVSEEREARYRQIVEDQTDPVARFRPDGNLTFVNGAYCRFFNKTDEELIGNGFFDSMTDEQALELRSRMTLLTPGQSTFKCEHEITITPAECRWVNWTFRAIFDVERKLVEIQSVARDVTDRKRAEIALKKSEARYSNLIKAIPDGVVAYDPQGNATYANDGFVQLYGWSQEEVLGRSINFVPPRKSRELAPPGRKHSKAKKCFLKPNE